MLIGRFPRAYLDRWVFNPQLRELGSQYVYPLVLSQQSQAQAGDNLRVVKHNL